MKRFLLLVCLLAAFINLHVAERGLSFMSFYPVKMTRWTRLELDLSISNDIAVHGHRGELYFEREEGEYVQFIICLPETS